MKKLLLLAITLGLFQACSPDCPDTTAQENTSTPEDSVTREVMTAELRDEMTPEEILEKFKEGNDRFVSGTMNHNDYRSQVLATTEGQHPYAAILSCIDSRKPAEIIFDKGIGDVFNVRIAGNFCNPDILGSLEYACKVAGSKVILILGHTGCGAVKAAIKQVELGNITQMLAKISPAVAAASETMPDGDVKNIDFVNLVSRENVLQARAAILEGSPILKKMHDDHEIVIACAMYDLSEGKVDFFNPK